MFVRKLLLDVSYIEYILKKVFFTQYFICCFILDHHTLYAGVFAFLSELFNGCELVFIWLHPS